MKQKGTLPEKIVELQQKVRDLKKASLLSPKYNPKRSSKLVAIKALEAACNNKENVDKNYTLPRCPNKSLTKEQTNKLSRILLANTMENIDCDSSKSSSNKKDSVIVTESEISQRSVLESPEEDESFIPVKLKAAEEMARTQAAKITALAKRNAFLEARHEQQKEQKKPYRGDLVKSMRLYAELKSQSKAATDNLKGGFESYCYIKMKGDSVDTKEWAKGIRGATRNTGGIKGTFKEFVDMKLKL